MRRNISGMLLGFARMPMKEKAALFIAWLCITATAFLLRLLPFRILAPLLGKRLGAVGWIPLIDQEKNDAARMVKRAVRRAASVAPFRSDCLPQVFAGSALCRILSIPTSSFLGVKLDGRIDMAAHAWMCAGPVPVTGGMSFGEYPVVMCFVQPGHLAENLLFNPGSVQS